MIERKDRTLGCWGAAVLAVASFSASLRAASPILLLDNFDQEKTENALGGATGAWMDPEDKSQSCAAERVQIERVGAQGRSLRLDYDIDSQREAIRVPTQFSVSNPAVLVNQAFNGYYSLLPSKDLRPYNYLIFWAKGDPVLGYTRSFKVELKDAAGVGGVVVDGVGPEWRRFAIPLRAFDGVKDWGAIREFVIVFAADVVTRKVGSLYLDEVFFAQNLDNNSTLPERERSASAPPKPVVVDGKVSEWPRRVWTDISGSEAMESGARGVRDTGARFAVQWDDQWLYLAAVLEDNERINTEEGEDLWRGDCLEVYVNPSGQDFSWGSPTAFQLGFSPTSKSGAPGRWAWFQRRAPTDDEVRVAWDKQRRTVEIALSWSFLGLTPGINRELGFSFAFHDKDAADGTPEAKLQWSFQSLGGKKVRLGKLVLQ